MCALVCGVWFDGGLCMYVTVYHAGVCERGHSMCACVHVLLLRS